VAHPGDENGDVEPGDCEDKENVLVENLQEENERLRRELLVLKRELVGRSPLKRKPLQERDDMPTAEPGMPRPYGGDGLNRKMEQLRVSEDTRRGSSGSARSGNAASPKKLRKLAAKKWDMSVEGDDLF